MTTYRSTSSGAVGPQKIKFAILATGAARGGIARPPRRGHLVANGRFLVLCPRRRRGHNPSQRGQTGSSGCRFRWRTRAQTRDRPHCRHAVNLRCTSRMLDVISGKPEIVDLEPSVDDWYASVTYIEGKKCVLLVHDGTLFSSLALDCLRRDAEADRRVRLQPDLPSPRERGPSPRRPGRYRLPAGPPRSGSVLGSMNDMVIMATHHRW
jgi:hypothetical protein